MNSPELDKCGNCKAEVTTDSDFCPHCGVLFEHTPIVACETDFDQEAIGVCIICRKRVCERCCEVKSKRMFCPEHNKVEVSQDWARVFQADNMLETELMRAFLASLGIPVVMQERGASYHGALIGAVDPRARERLRHPSKVFVPIPEYLKAIEHLQSWNSAQAIGESFETDNT